MNKGSYPALFIQVNFDVYIKVMAIIQILLHGSIQNYQQQIFCLSIVDLSGYRLIYPS